MGIDEILRRRTTEYVAPTLIASVYRWLGDKDAMYQWLETAIDERDWWLGRLPFELWTKEIRSEPRYASVIGRVGLLPMTTA